MESTPFIYALFTACLIRSTSRSIASFPMCVVCFEYLMNKIMVHRELPTPKAAACICETLVHAHVLRAHAQPGEGYAPTAYFIGSCTGGLGGTTQPNGCGHSN